jgi:hypothetical protein
MHVKPFREAPHNMQSVSVQADSRLAGVQQWNGIEDIASEVRGAERPRRLVDSNRCTIKRQRYAQIR